VSYSLVFLCLFFSSHFVCTSSSSPHEHQQ
jgi:hypothetical protein